MLVISCGDVKTLKDQQESKIQILLALIFLTGFEDLRQL